MWGTDEADLHPSPPPPPPPPVSSSSSGVVEYLSTGGVDCTHKDFKELRYSDSLTNFNCNGKNPTSNGRITHGFKLKSAYEEGLMPYTNYTYDFKVSLKTRPKKTLPLVPVSD